jgi:hypothetical protein
MRRFLVPIAAAALVIGHSFTAMADNQMGYQLLTRQEAARFPHNGGKLGMDIEAAERITDSGMTFDLIRIKSVSRGSAGAKAGFARGAEIIAVDGKVFDSLATFAAYVAATAPGNTISVDYIPAGGGPQNAQRVAVTVAGPGQEAPREGMSTGKKIAIGVGAAALFGCYEMGCFSSRSPAAGAPAR